MKSRLLAISAISAALVAISLTVGAYVDMADIFSLVIASAFVLLPLYYDSFKACFLSFAAGGVIALIFSIPKFYSVVFPSYFLFFGVYPIIANLVKRNNFNLVLWRILGIVWCVAFFYGAYFYYTLVLGLSLGSFPAWLSWLADNIVWFIAGFAIAFYFIFDRFIFVVKCLIDRYLDKIVKK